MHDGIHKYRCPHCRVILFNDSNMIGQPDVCPNCTANHSVPADTIPPSRFAKVLSKANVITRSTREDRTYELGDTSQVQSTPTEARVLRESTNENDGQNKSAIIVFIVICIAIAIITKQRPSHSDSNSSYSPQSGYSASTTLQPSKVWATCVALALEMESRGTPITYQEVFARVARSYDTSPATIERLYWEEENKFN